VLEKTPVRGAGSANADTGAGADNYQSRFWALLDGVTKDFLELARIPPETTEWFQNAIGFGIKTWLDREARNKLSEEQRPIADTFEKFARTALELHQDLRRLEPVALNGEWSGDLPESGDEIYHLELHLQLQAALASLSPPLTITALRDGLAVLAETTYAQGRLVRDDVDLPRQWLRRGRSIGNDGRPMKYKNVAHDLVWALEHDAHWAGGGFTLDRACTKGSLLQALDGLRKQLLQEQEWCWIAQFLPSKNDHPVATYQRVMVEARRWAEAELRGLDPRLYR
jgi:hypothetical protein